MEKRNRHVLGTRDANDSIFLNPRDILGGDQLGNAVVVQLGRVAVEDGLVEGLHRGRTGSLGLGNHAVRPVEMRSTVVDVVGQFDLKEFSRAGGIVSMTTEKGCCGIQGSEELTMYELVLTCPLMSCRPGMEAWRAR